MMLQRFAFRIESSGGSATWRHIESMRGPGDQIVEAAVKPDGRSGFELQLTSTFLPHGLAGILYGHLSAPLHRQTLRRLGNSIALASAARSALTAGGGWRVR